MTPNKNYVSPTIDGLIVLNRVVLPFSPSTFEPDIADVLFSLPKINRYNGYTKFPYSVAQHCLLCHKVLKEDAFYADRPHLLLYALLHDCAEAYLQDLVRPIKQYMSDEYFDAEEIITDKLLRQLLNNDEMDDVRCSLFQNYMKEVDTRMAVTEMVQLLGVENPLPAYEPFNFKIMEVHWNDVRNRYSFMVAEMLGILANK